MTPPQQGAAAQRGAGVVARCGWCGGPHEIQWCPAVRFAFEDGYTPYTGNEASSERDDASVFRGRALTGRRGKALTK